ncbi:MAG: LLM class flavin-dependent oxidoreductase [Chloroflexi bacterium]|nr:LLM class flavin-dependent oxidoreductase [Chloroflexota bacterium]
MNRMEQFSTFIFAAGDPPPSADQIIQAAKHAERLGFDSITLAHHLRLPTSWVYGALPSRDLLDPLVMLPAMAMATTEIRIGTNAAIMPILPPYVWAKYFASLDVLSRGRVIAGMAMGWFQQDFEAAGIERRHRGPMFDEQLEVVTRLWTEDRVTYTGRFYQLKEAELAPKPVQKPYPPIWVGGFLPSVARAARYGRYLVPGNLTVEEVRDTYVPRLREAASGVGTDTQLCLNVNIDILEGEDRPSEETLARLKRAVNFFDEPHIQPEKVAIIGPPERCAQRIIDYQQAGVAHFLMDFQYHGAVSIDYAMMQMELFVEKVVPLLT